MIQNTLYTINTKYTLYMSEDTTIRVSKKTKKAIEDLGNLSDTYDSVILKLADHYKKCKRKNGEK